MVVTNLLSSPAFIGAVGVAATLVAAAGYSYFTGNEASVDIDDDGTDEVTFGSDTNVAETPNSDPRESTEDTDKPPMYEEQPTETAVGPDLPDDLEDVTGIGPTRAEAFRDDGFENPSDIYYASDNSLEAVHGIGPKAISDIRGDIGGVDYTENPEMSGEVSETEAIDELGGSAATDEPLN